MRRHAAAFHAVASAAWFRSAAGRGRRRRRFDDACGERGQATVMTERDARRPASSEPQETTYGVYLTAQEIVDLRELAKARPHSAWRRPGHWLAMMCW